MNLNLYKTKFVRSQDMSPTWWVVDAKGKTVGRLASEIAIYIMGKHKPYFTEHVKCGDKVIIVNADKVKFTGKKMEDKTYMSYSKYPGGQKTVNPVTLLQKKPSEVLLLAVKGMLPKNKQGRELVNYLFIYPGSDHPHTAQNPQNLHFDKK